MFHNESFQDFFFFFKVTTFISEAASAQLPARQARFTDSVVAVLSGIVPTQHMPSRMLKVGL